MTRQQDRKEEKILWQNYEERRTFQGIKMYIACLGCEVWLEKVEI
jgi:hypothetical protein